MLKITYRESDRKAVLVWESQDDQAPWLDVLKRLVFDNSEDATQEGGFQIVLPWWAFSSLRSQLLEIFKGFNLKLGAGLHVEEKAAELLRRSTHNVNGYDLAVKAHSLAPDTIVSKLHSAGFQRSLTAAQLRNVCKLAGVTAGATFSVPGAGKTTEALAVFFCRANDDERLLVIAPKNAFASWDEQLQICLPALGQSFVRLRGGQEKISRLLDDRPRFMLISYQQFTRVKSLIAGFVDENKVHLFLDESHRIKAGTERQSAQAVLGLSHLPVSKLIMSGTPMPQEIGDLIPQFTFLYPEIPATPASVVELMRPIYVRTTKNELGLPPVERVVTRVPMAPVQAELYKLMKLEIAREAATALTIRSKQAFRALGRSVARVLQFVSNPSLLSNQIEFAHPDLLRAVLSEGDGPKLAYLLKKVRQLARNGHKVLVWSSFVRNVEYIALRLADLGAVYIHGGVDTGDEDDDETREGKIKLFHDDDNVMVMVANPAAASEGVSLHTVCHHAIYLDRTFNAAHYLQSEDRIHRLGLPPHQQTLIEILECTATVDETVRDRLGQKIGAMGQALNDPSLQFNPILVDPTIIDDPDDFLVGRLDSADVEALLRDFTKEGEQ